MYTYKKFPMSPSRIAEIPFPPDIVTPHAVANCDAVYSIAVASAASHCRTAVRTRAPYWKKGVTKIISMEQRKIIMMFFHVIDFTRTRLRHETQKIPARAKKLNFAQFDTLQY